MKQDKAEKMIQKAERKAQKAAQQVQATAKKAEARKEKDAAKAQKKAAKLADAATKKADKKTKKADAIAKKAQLAAQKAEEKKAKAVAKAAAKAVEDEDGGEEGEGGAPAKGKKKKQKLLLIAIPVLAVVVGAGLYFFVLRGDEEEPEGPPEPIAIPVEYELAERKITALPVWGDEVLVYREEVKPEPAAKPEEDQADDASPISDSAGEEGEEEETAEAPPEEEEEEGFTKILYRYEGLQNPGALVAAYTAVMITEDAGFSTVDETLLRIDPPEFEEMPQEGSVLLARNVPAIEDVADAGVQSMLLSWDVENCSVLLDMPEGKVHDPKPETPASAAASRRGLSDLRAMEPAQLGLPGESMEEYTLMVQEGSVRIANDTCMRVNIYDEDSQIAASVFISSTGKLYRLEEAVNGVVELEWE